MTHHILVVDDEPPTLDLMRLMLKLLGYSTDTAATGTDAVAHARSRRPDVILLDAMLPDMTGFEVCALLKQDAATVDIPVVMLTAMLDNVARDKAASVGVDHFLNKPITKAQLQETLEDILRNS